jgi:hypothetical protein
MKGWREMIVRVWRGSASAGNAARYRRHVLGTVFPSLPAIPGHRGAILLTRAVDGGTEFLALTLWEDMRAVSGFAGDHAEAAVVEPEARAALAEYDDVVRHFEVAHWDVPGAGGA